MTGGFLLSDMSPQGAQFQVFPALPRAVVSFLRAPAGVWCGAGFLGLCLCQEGVESARFRAPGSGWGQASLSLSSPRASPQLCTELPFECCLHKALHGFGTRLEEGAAFSFAEEIREPFAPSAELPFQPLSHEKHPCSPPRASPGGLHWRSPMISWL